MVHTKESTSDGFRGVMGKDFSFDSVGRAATGFSRHCKAGRVVVIGYDTRFRSKEFAERASQTMRRSGISVIVSSMPVPTPAVTTYALRNKLDGTFMVTASHFPWEYNGIVMRFSDGRPPTNMELATMLRSESKRQREPACQRMRKKRVGDIRYENIRRWYVEFLLSSYRTLLDLFKIGENKNLLVDTIHGTTAGVLSTILRKFGWNITEIRSRPPRGIEGERPDPIEPNLTLLSRRVKDSGTIGVAFDCDGDRLSFVHPTAGFVGPYVIPPLVLLAVDKYKRDLIKCPVSPKIVKTLPVTMRVNQIARKLGLSVTEVPVGFANVHSTMSGENAMIGLGDDSSVTFPNDRTKDSVLTSLVLLALNNALDLKVTLDKLSREYGQLFHFKNNIRYKDVAKVRSVLKAFPELCGELSCTRTVPFESGIKAFFPQGWILLRVSGTEDSVRIYAESRSKRVLESDVSRINSFVCEKLEASPKHTSYTKLN